jgi:hypothetical protein
MLSILIRILFRSIYKIDVNLFVFSANSRIFNVVRKWGKYPKYSWCYNTCRTFLQVSSFSYSFSLPNFEAFTKIASTVLFEIKVKWPR